MSEILSLYVKYTNLGPLMVNVNYKTMGFDNITTNKENVVKYKRKKKEKWKDMKVRSIVCLPILL
jgi:hypothetical protein